MASVKQGKKRAPLLTPEGREDYLIHLAYDEVEKRILNGTASSQETTFFLRQGSRKQRLEEKKLEVDIKLQQVKEKEIQSSLDKEALMERAIKSFGIYEGKSEDDDDMDEWENEVEVLY